MSSPWRPPELAQFTALGVGLSLEPGGELQESAVTWDPANRIIVSEYARENLYDRIARAEDLKALRQLADLTNPVIQAETGLLDLVPPEDRLYGAGTGLIMAAFTFPGRPTRFSDGALGTFYAAQNEPTAVAETRYHQERFLQGSGPTVVEMTLLHVRVEAPLVDIRADLPRPPDAYHPTDYRAGQLFGGLVRRLRGYGIVYHSVRDHPAACAAIFRPPVLAQCRPARLLEYHWDGRKITAVR